MRLSRVIDVFCENKEGMKRLRLKITKENIREVQSSLSDKNLFK